MGYFSFTQPITYWSLAAPNILQRVKISDDIISQGQLYDSYVIEEGDRPDTIAYHYYGDATLDWLVRLANNIFDEASQWPLTQSQLDQYIANKYTSVPTAQSTTDHYKLKTNVTINNSTYAALPNDAKVYFYNNGTSYSIITSVIQLSSESLVNLPGEVQQYWQSVSQYENEFEINEEKRHILLIDAAYAQEFDSALKGILTNG
jgi:hypothetical protein